MDRDEDKVFAYSSGGHRVSSDDFNLHSANARPEGIAYSGGRFYMLDNGADKVYVYARGGGRLSSRDFNLNSGNTSARGITYADGRFYVVDSSDEKVYVYDATDGAHVPSANIDLDSDNRDPQGITYADGQLFVLDVDEDKVYAYRAGSGDGPDLVVESPRSTETSVEPRGAFRFAVTVINRGAGRSAVTTLRYYRSSDSRITTSDTPVGTDPVGGLSGSGSAQARPSIGQRAPSTPGTYCYGACVDPVSGESNTANNCSSGVRVTVTGDGLVDAPDLVVESPRSTASSVEPGGAIRFAATVRNQGEDRSAATTLRYYRSSDSRITTSDTPVGTDRIGALSASATDRQSIGQRVPSMPGTYYYGACVDSVSGESNRVNNCSEGVRVTVTGGDGGALLFDDDFASGDAGRWDVAGSGSVGGDPGSGRLAVEGGVLKLVATAGGNYDVRVQKDITVDGAYGGYSLSFDWKAVTRETPYGLDGAHLLFYDGEGQVIGNIRAVNSGQTRRGGNPLEHACSRAAIDDRRCAGIAKLAETFDWEQVSLDTAMIPGMDPANVARLELRAWVYNDAGSGGEMHFDNFELQAGNGGSGGGALASFGNFHVIEHDLSESQDHSVECTRRLGSEFRLADWNDLVAYHNGGGSLAAFRGRPQDVG